ncbi:hypothetical protein [Candidatus Neptunochlamydia vexilliferae]|uniref:Uncharacterized protein n=1 Tax=Candidatus Neptunichlamydia vexilliferae TaxID=1651774 RepID=A0ABS0AX77_9BACT|nr:hypothetical protein [Candidatus Neptunochlamydia vexilliferae]MBF5058744.1 hypothetical protein [Candidatus Neptunochlamydia vexilliferae]
MNIKGIFSTQTFFKAKDFVTTKTFVTHAVTAVASAFFTALAVYFACRKPQDRTRPELENSPKEASISLEELKRLLPNENITTTDDAKSKIKSLREKQLNNQQTPSSSSSSSSSKQSIVLEKKDLENLIRGAKLGARVTKASQQIKTSVLSQLLQNSRQLRSVNNFKKDLEKLINGKEIKNASIDDLIKLKNQIKSGLKSLNSVLGLVEQQLKQNTQNWQQIQFTVSNLDNSLLQSTAQNVSSSKNSEWQAILKEKHDRLKHHLDAIGTELQRRGNAFLVEALKNINQSVSLDQSSSDDENSGWSSSDSDSD